MRKKRIYKCPCVVVLSMMSDEMMVSIGASRQAYGQADENEWISADEIQQINNSSKVHQHDLWADPSDAEESKMPSLW